MRLRSAVFWVTTIILLRHWWTEFDVTWRFHIPLCPHYIISYNLTFYHPSSCNGKIKGSGRHLDRSWFLRLHHQVPGIQTRREHQNMPWFGRTATATGVWFMKAGVAWWDLVIIGIELLNMINHALGISTQSRRNGVYAILACRGAPLGTCRSQGWSRIKHRSSQQRSGHVRQKKGPLTRIVHYIKCSKVDYLLK